MTIGIGLIGAGVMGGDHARILTKGVAGAALVAVHDADPARAGAIASGGNGVAVVPDTEALIADRRVDAVLVASPDETHAELVLACLARRKPVLCEKPLAATLDGCRAILEAEQRVGARLVQVGYMRRFDPGYRQLRDLRRDGRLGPPLFFHCVHRNAIAPHFMTNAMIISNAAVHEIDIARFVLEDEIEAVTVVSPRPTSRAPTRRPQFLVFETRQGVVVDVEAFVDAGYGYDVRAELVCETGTALLAPHPPVATRESARDGFAVEADWRGRFAAAYRAQLEAWVASVRAGGAPAGGASGASAWDGMVASIVAEAALESARTARRVALTLEARPPLYD